MSLRKLLVAGLAAAVHGGAAHAQVSRVFVSVNGNDANVCSNIATPCRTLGGGITQVDPHGEVIVIDSGSFAGGTITKSVKIDVAAGAVAFSGLPITVDPGAGGVVVLRGLTLKAATVGNGNGITHESGRLFVENSVVDGWDYGLVVNPGAERLFVKRSVFRNQSGSGLFVGGSASTTAVVDESFVEGNGLHGVVAAVGKVRVSNSVVSLNALSGVLASGSTANVAVQRSEITGNVLYGVAVQSSGIARVSHSTISHNGTGLYHLSGSLYSYGNNLVAENLMNTSGTITTATLQ